MSSPLAVGTIGRVQCVVFAVRLVPGQAEAARVALASYQAGARKEAYQALQAARALMADIFDGPPQFTDLTIAQEWTG